MLTDLRPVSLLLEIGRLMAKAGAKLLKTGVTHRVVVGTLASLSEELDPP